LNIGAVKAILQSGEQMNLRPYFLHLVRFGWKSVMVVLDIIILSTCEFRKMQAGKAMLSFQISLNDFTVKALTF
jgi:hypothetical protein